MMPLKQTLRAIAFGAVFATTMLAHADAGDSARSEALVKQGQALAAAGKRAEALEAYQAAALADPLASLPLALAVEVLVETSNHKWGESRTQLRRAAEAAGREALRRDPADERNVTLMAQLLDMADPPLNHEPLADARQALIAGEIMWEQGDFDGERRQVQLALALDPHHAQAWTGAGRNQLRREEYAEAVRSLRRATELEPLLARAWYLLALALDNQGERAAAEAAALGAIAAQPNAALAWVLLAHLRNPSAPRPKEFKFVVKASAKTDPVTDVIRIGVHENAYVTKDSPDWEAWTTYAVLVEPSPNGDHATSALQAELAAWRAALKDGAQESARSGVALRDPDLLALRAFEEAGQLEPAVMLLLYKESYRADFEAWKLAHPDGISNFTAAWGLCP